MSFNAWVGGWSRSRQVVLAKREITLEVARINCSHCPTCRGRLDYVQSRLNGEGKQTYEGGGVLVTLPYPTGLAKTPETAASFLSGKLGLTVIPA